MVKPIKPPKTFENWISCPTNEILQFLLDMELRHGEFQMTPSNFYREMQYSTEQRYEKLSSPMRTNFQCGIKTFKVVPDIVVFQNFQVGVTYSVTLTLTNTDDVSRPLRFEMEPTTYFSIQHVSDGVSTKVAPGLKYTLEVRFLPEYLKDYKHKVTFITANETFDIMLLAIGPRPILDLPDRIVIPSTALLIPTERTIQVRNIGQVPASFILGLRNNCFHTPKTRVMILPNETFQLTINFTPNEIGLNLGELKLTYESGEMLYIKLESFAEEADVKLTSSRVDFTDTYLGLSEERSITLQNDSMYIVDYEWTIHDCPKCLAEARSYIKERFDDLMTYELSRDTKLDYFNIVDAEMNKEIYERILEEQKKKCDSSADTPFNDDNFKIYPLSGQLWPKTKVNFNILYIPTAVDLHKSLAFLHVNACKKRYYLETFGSCIGPKVILNLDELDAQNIYIGSTHHYEVVFRNVGPIPATITYLETHSDYGGVFTFSVDEFALEPEEIKSFHLTFVSLTRGNFVEEIRFQIVESKQVLSFIMSGNIVCPLLNFHMTEIDFGDISVGQTIRRKVALENSTQVDIAYKLEVIESPQTWVPSETTISDISEFKCTETEGVVCAFSCIHLFIEATPFTAKSKSAELAIYMWDTRQNSRSVHLKYNAHVPSLCSSTESIFLKSIFITQVYYRTITLENKSEYIGLLQILAVQDSENLLEIIPEKSEIYFNKWEICDLRISVKTDYIRDMKGKLVGIFPGAGMEFTICDIIVLSRGPCIDSDLVNINIGRTKTLTLIEKRFTVSNDSPINAIVNVIVNGPFVTPLHPVIHLGPEETFETALKIYGTSAGKFKTIVKLEIEGTDPDSVAVTGEFFGGSISTSPPVEPVLNIGSVSTLTISYHEVILLNEGKVPQIVTIKEVGTEVIPHNVIMEDMERPFIIMSQNQFILPSCKEYVLRFDCFSKYPCHISTRFVCHAKKMSKRNNMIRKILDFKVLVSFEIPRVTLSKQYVEFRVDIGTTGVIAVTDDDITLMNQSNVPLYMEICLDEPFYFLSGDQLHSRQDVTLKPGEGTTCTIKFAPQYKEKRIQICRGHMRVQYTNQPYAEKLPLLGIVNYPNVSFDPSYVEFGCVENGQPAYRLVTLQNLSPLVVEYSFELKENNLSVTPIIFTPKTKQIESSSSSYDSLIDVENVTIIPREKEISSSFNLENSIHFEESGEEGSEHIDSKLKIVSDESSETIIGSNDCLELAKKTLENEELAEHLRCIITPLIDQYKEDVKVSEIYTKLFAYSQIPVKYKQRYIDLVPNSGTLGPYEANIISISLNLPPKSELVATLTCNVNGGVSTDLDIFAKSGKAYYFLKSKVVDFGTIAFNKITETTFRIENTGYSNFEFSIRYEEYPSENFIGDSKWLWISPATGIVTENTFVDIIVKYFPSIPGYFETPVSLEIAYYNPIKVIIKGCGILPQFYFDFPRPLDEELNKLSYSAIAGITYPCHSSCEELFTKESEPAYNDWVYVRYKRHYPSVKDIAMALERQIVQVYLQQNPELITFKYNNQMAVIPDLVLPPYIIDLGYVILNTCVDTMIIPRKYTETAVRFYWQRIARKTLELGFTMVFQKGQPGPYLIFKPTSKVYQETNTPIVGHISCIVSTSMKIDFEVRAVVTVPSLMFKRSAIEFGRVQCGFCLRKLVFLENNGAVKCNYKCLIQSSTERPTNIFFTKAREGIVEAGQKNIIEIYFQPQAHTRYEWRFIATIESNNQPLKISLRGFGVMPQLGIMDDRIYFEPTLPYSINNVQYFKIINQSPFPVEICFTDFDRNLDEEGAIVNILLNYYNVKTLFIPPRPVGSALPQPLVDIYNLLMDKLRLILKRKIRMEFEILVRKYIIDDRDYQSSAELEIMHSLSNMDAIEIPDPLKNKSYAEIHALFLENILDIDVKHESSISIRKGGSIFEIEEYDAVGEENNRELKEGVLIIFYGSALTDYLFAANVAARVLDMRVSSVDKLIFQALMRNNTLAANKVNQEIMNAVNNINTHLKYPDDYDSLDILIARVALIKDELVHVPSKSLEKKVKIKQKSSHGSDTPSTVVDSQRDKKKNTKNSETLLNIPLEIYYELLKDSLSKYRTGVIIETLKSDFIQNTCSVLIGLLKGVGNIRYIQGIYFSVTPEHYLQRIKEQELRHSENKTDLGEIVTQVIEMDPDKFANITPYEMNIYRNYHLKIRKVRTEQRLSVRDKRVQDKYLQKPRSNKNLGNRLKSIFSHVGKSELGTRMSKKHLDSNVEIIQILQNCEIEGQEIINIFENWHRVLGEVQVESKSKGKKNNKIKEAKNASKLNSTKSSSKRSKSKSSHNSELSDVLVGSVPQKIQVKILTPDEMEEHRNLGIPLWYIRNAQSSGKLSYSDLVANYLEKDKDLKEALSLAYIGNSTDNRDLERLYTVLTEPKSDRYRHISNAFAIYDVTTNFPPTPHPSVQVDFDSMSMQYVPKKSSTNSLQKSSVSLQSNKKKKKTSAIKKSSVIISKTLIPRRIMQPDDVLYYEVNFFPEYCGVYSHNYYIEIVTFPIPFRVTLEGKADIPRLFVEPSIIFTKTLPSKDGHDLAIAYFEKEETYHMGAIVVQEESKRIDCLITEDKLKLINDSYLPCDVTLAFIDQTSNFSFESCRVLIASNNSVLLSIRGHPVKAGNINTQMIITTQNNPRVNLLKVSCIGTTFLVDITPRNVFFERVLLDRTVTIDVELKNLSLLGCNWAIDSKQLMENFGLNLTSGYLKPLGSNTITFAYKASEYKTVPANELVVKFYDKFKYCSEPILLETLNLSSEVVEVDIEFETDVHLGDIKIGQLFTAPYTIRNKSKFELTYSFEPLTDPPENNLVAIIRNSTSIDSCKGIIKPNETIKVQIKLKINYPIEFKSVPVYRCVISDSLIEREVVDFTLKVTGKVFNSLYKLCPSEELTFATQLVDTEVKKDIVLHNKGKYSFTFMVLSAAADDGLKPKKNDSKSKSMLQNKGSKKSNISVKTSAKSKKSSLDNSKSAKSDKSGKKKRTSLVTKKVKPTVLKQGIFTIIPSSGVVESHSETYIQIFCKPKKVGRYEEKINFFISGVTDKFANGHPLILYASASVPKIDFTNLDNIFKQHMIVESFDEALCNRQMQANCVFVVVDKTFYFNCTCLHLQKKARLTLRNVGEIGAYVHASIINNNDVFQIEPSNIYIQPYCSELFVIDFIPTALEKYTGSVIFTVEMSDLKLQIGLVGEGCLPTVQIIEPALNDRENYAEVNYKLVLLNTQSIKRILLTNPGLLDSSIIVGIEGDAKNLLAIQPQICDNLVGIQSSPDIFSHSSIFEIKSGSTVEINITFSPTEEVKMDCEVKIFVSNNPYEVYKIHLCGVGYKEDIIFEELESFVAGDEIHKSISSKTPSLIDLNSSQSALLAYNLNFGYRYVNQLNKMYFKIKNISDHLYKFQFIPMDNLNYIPLVGHLKPNCCKDIIVTFFSKDPIIHDREMLTCRICKIQYTDCEVDNTALSWDQRQHCIITMPDSDACISSEDIFTIGSPLAIEHTTIIDTKSEPAYIEIEGSARSILLVFSITADYCSYEVDTDCINFSKTAMFQSSTSDFVVRNTSMVPLDIEWSLIVANPPKKSNAQTSLLFPEAPKIKTKKVYNRPQTCYYGKRPVQLTGAENFVNLVTRPKSAQSVSSLFSTTFSTGMESMHSYSDTDPIPLTVYPMFATIEPYGSVTFTFRFAPYSSLVYEFLADSNIPNLHPDLEAISINVFASGELPLYHFKLPHSDYLNNRQCIDQCDVGVDQNTQVVEFHAIGFNIPVNSKFSIINPTSSAFTYRWERGNLERNVSLFRCETPEGSLLRNSKAEVDFTFIAQKAGTFELLYYFTIAKYALRVMFLLVGHSREPCVFFKDNGLILKPTVMGIDVHDIAILKNTERIPLNFKVNVSTLYNEGRTHKIGVEPLKGILISKGEIPIKIKFHPTQVGDFTFNVEFVIDRLQKPVVLTISAKCYNVQATLKVIKEYSTIELSVDTENVIPMPALVHKNGEECKFVIGNIGYVGFYYKWDANDKFIDDFVYLEINPREGYVRSASQSASSVIVKPVKFLNKKHIKLILKILYGPTISVTLVCSTCKTKLKFSDHMHDFGACLTQKHKTYNNEWVLEISNYDYIQYFVQFDSSEHSHLTMMKRETVLAPKQTIKLYFYFHPTTIGRFNTNIDILINDKPYPITLIGEGVPMEVELLDVRDKFLDFGSVPLGKYVKKRVHIINKTKCAVNIYFELHNRLPIFFKTTRHLEPDFEHIEIKPSDDGFKKSSNEIKESRESKERASKSSKGSKRTKGTKGTKGTKATRGSKSSKGSRASRGSKTRASVSKKSDKKERESIGAAKSDKQKKGRSGSRITASKDTQDSVEELERCLVHSAIRIRPLKWIKLYPQNSTEFTITYFPPERMLVFQEQIYCQVEDTVIPLCVVKASCIAPLYTLQKSKLSFGTVILGASNTHNTMLINSGDIGGKFKWSWKSSKSVSYTISPMEGYSSPGTSTTFTVVFNPPFVQCNHNTSAILKIENYKTTFELELSGTCINLPNPADTLIFSGPVRECYKKKFTLKNSTPERWVIKPSISGSYFSVPELIVIDAKSTYTGEVTYAPLKMTLNNKLHEGKLFLPLPEGQGILYDLLGESLRPRTAAIIEKTIPSKTYNSIPLDVHNWLKVTHQFSVENQVEQINPTKKVIYKLTGNMIVEIPPLTVKPYNWKIYTLNEGKVNFIVKFRIEDTKEYICYELRLTIVKCEVLDTFVLSARARQVAEFRLKLENPLGDQTTYKLSSPCHDLYFAKEATVLPYTEIELLIEYKPLYPVNEFTTLFEAVSASLGTFPYHFILSASNADLEATILVKSPLGIKTITHAYIYNPSRQSVEFTAKIENPVFSLERNVTAMPKEKGLIEVGFEPSDLGAVHSKLVLSSPILGNYTYPLNGIGILPKPSGPYIIKPNFQTNITFKNPFSNAMVFKYLTSNDAFELKTSSEHLKPFMATKININCNPAYRDSYSDINSIITGKLIITCDEEGYRQIEWIMYLQSDFKI